MPRFFRGGPAEMKTRTDLVEMLERIQQNLVGYAAHVDEKGLWQTAGKLRQDAEALENMARILSAASVPSRYVRALDVIEVLPSP